MPRKDRKGVLFVATFRHREFERKRKFWRENCSICYDDFAIWTKANYFIILYRYSHGRFLQISRMETDFKYETKTSRHNLKMPIYKDLTGVGMG